MRLKKNNGLNKATLVPLILILPFFFIASLLKKPEPQEKKDEVVIQKQFYEWKIPGTLQDAQAAGFSCNISQHNSQVTSCKLKNANICGASADLDVWLRENGKPGPVYYESISIDAPKPLRMLENVCEKDDGIVLIDTKGREIKDKKPTNCVRDKREVIDEALIKCGWTKTYRKGSSYYTHPEYNVRVSHSSNGEYFEVQGN